MSVNATNINLELFEMRLARVDADIRDMFIDYFVGDLSGRVSGADWCAALEYASGRCRGAFKTAVPEY